MRLGLLGRELAAADELGDERVVVGQLLELAAADAVGARVADVADRDRRRRRRRARRSSSCPSPTRRRPRSSAGRRGGSPPGSARRRAPRRRSSPAPSFERGRGEPRRDLAGLRAAHAVGDREQRRLADVRVLVAPALAPGSVTAAMRGRASRLEPQLGLADADDVARGEPPRRRHAARRSRTCRSSSRRPRPRRRRAAARSARARPRRTRRRRAATSFWPPRPIVSGAESSRYVVARVERGALDDDEPGALAGARRAARSLASGVEDRSSPAGSAQVPAGAAHDPPDEEVEQDEEGDLEDEQRLVDLASRADHVTRSAAEDEVGRAERDAVAVARASRA